MGMGMSRFPDPYESRDDLSHATVFLVVLVLLLSVGAILFFGNAWLFAPVQAPSFLSTSSTTPLRSTGPPTPAEPPTFTAPTPVPPLAGIPFKPTPNGTPTVTPTAKSPANGASTATPGPNTPTPQSTTPTSATATPSHPTPSPAAHVGNTGGDGAYLRHTPRLTDTWVAWRDNTPLTLTGAEADGDGEHWLQVRDPKGDAGWMPARYVIR